jgi:hypothetical protein
MNGAHGGDVDKQATTLNGYYPRMKILNNQYLEKVEAQNALSLELSTL